MGENIDVLIRKFGIIIWIFGTSLYHTYNIIQSVTMRVKYSEALLVHAYAFKMQNNVTMKRNMTISLATMIRLVILKLDKTRVGRILNTS